MEVILASASPRRRQLLHKIIDDFAVIDSGSKESAAFPDPAETAKSRALEKAEAVFSEHSDCVVIGCDTVVHCGGTIYGKPRSADDAKRILRQLSGKSHVVTTAYAVLTKEKRKVCSCGTTVTFKVLSEEEISRYVATGSPMDKAGAYGIQDSGFAEKIDGSYDNVVGLPTEMLAETLKQFGIIVKNT